MPTLFRSLSCCPQSTTFGLATAAVMLSALASPASAGDLIFADDFESGGVSAWSLAVGYTATPADAYRYSDLDLRDPHVLADLPVFGCTDFTDQDLPAGFGPSLNASIETALTTDGDEDGLLDASQLLLFRPFDEQANGERLDLQPGSCTAPIETTTCELAAGTLPTATTYNALDSGMCLTTVAGTTSGYSPGVAEPVAPCFVSLTTDLTVSFLGVDIVLRDAQVAGAQVGSPLPTSFDSGLLRGFLGEVDADQILLPADLPVIGGEPLSILLPGGSGNCAAGDDRDVLDETVGWWFYLNFAADAVPLTR